MQLKFKNNPIGYFQFFYGVAGNKLLVSIFLSIAVATLDGFGLTMVMPMLQSFSGTGGGDSKKFYGAFARAD